MLIAGRKEVVADVWHQASTILCSLDGCWRFHTIAIFVKYTVVFIHGVLLVYVDVHDMAVSRGNN